MDTTEPEVREVLDRAMVARLATVSRNGRPHVNPLYFVVDGDHVHLGTAISTLAAHNVAANPRVQLLLESESDLTDTRIVRLEGTALVRTQPDLLAHYRRAVARKYVVTPRGLWNLLVHPRQWRAMRRHLGGGGACVIDVAPTTLDVLQWPDARATSH